MIFLGVFIGIACSFGIFLLGIAYADLRMSRASSGEAPARIGSSQFALVRKSEGKKKPKIQDDQKAWMKEKEQQS